MLKRLAQSGMNIGVLVLSVAVFAAAFVLLNAVGAAQKPATIRVLAGARNFQIGDAIRAEDLVELQVYQDEVALHYIPAEAKADLAGGVVTLPMQAGQPLLKEAILQPGDASRLAALLERYPQGSLFPLPLDSQNVVAPEVSAFFPGDWVDLTVVLAYRPQERATPAATPAVLIAGAEPTPLPSAPPSELDKALERGYPPLAKSLFPSGVQVVAVQGQPPAAGTTPSEMDTAAPAGLPSAARPLLMLLVPQESQEALALALAQGDRLIVSLVARGAQQPTYGWSYWDFETWFRAERNERIDALPTATKARP